MALNIDLAPTLAQLAGLEIPASVEGRSLVPLLDQSEPAWREDFLVEQPPYRKQYTYAAVRTVRWKYVENEDEEGLRELYDLERDPNELDNLLVTAPDDPEVVGVAARLAARLEVLQGK